MRRLHADDIAIIGHADLDRVSATRACRVGRARGGQRRPVPVRALPRTDPLQLVRGGVRLIDVEGPDHLRDALGRRAADRPRRQPLPQRHLPGNGSRARGARSSPAPSASSRVESRRRCRSLRTTRSAICATRASCSPRGSTSRRSRRASATARRSSSRAGQEFQARPQDRARLRPRLQPVLVAVDGGADALIERVDAGRDRRGHGLRHRRDAALRRRDPRARLPRGLRPRRGAAAPSPASPSARSPRRGSPRTSRFCSPTTRAPS